MFDKRTHKRTRAQAHKRTSTQGRAQGKAQGRAQEGRKEGRKEGRNAGAGKHRADAGSLIAPAQADRRSRADCKRAPTVMWEDNKAAIAFRKNQTCHYRSKHIDIRAYWLRDLVLEGSILMLHIATEDQLADFLTKHLRGPAHSKSKNLVLGGWPLERNKGERVHIVDPG